jgi:hypothetical protein
LPWDPNFETLVDPAEVFPESNSVQYEPVECGDYVLSRFEASFSYRKAGAVSMSELRKPPFPSVKWWNSRWFDVSQLVLFFGALIWLTLNGAAQMGYNWQWYRLPQVFLEGH